MRFWGVTGEQLIGGDFNKVLSNKGKRGKIVDRSRSFDFLDVINYCEFIDMGFKGRKYIWLNKRLKNCNSLILERLDRILATNDWLVLYSNAHMLHLLCIHSDHCPLLLIMYTDDPTFRKKNVTLEKIWEMHLKFTNVITQV